MSEGLLAFGTAADDDADACAATLGFDLFRSTVFLIFLASSVGLVFKEPFSLVSFWEQVLQASLF